MAFTLKNLVWPKNRWMRISVVVVVLLVVPYAYSRVMSIWRRVQVFSINDPSPTEHDPGRLRIACYNIAHGRGLSRSNFTGESTAVRYERLDRIGDLLRELDVDIVVLNEVDFRCLWSNSINQAKRIAERGGFPYRVEQRSMDFRVLFWTMRYGNAILSKYPIEKAEVIDFPRYSKVESLLIGKKRGVNCTIRVGQQRIRVLGAHLSHRTETVRVPSAEMLAAITKRSEIPVVIAGDLNSTPEGFPDAHYKNVFGENSIHILDQTNSFQRTPMTPPDSEDRYTFSADNPRSVIDWIFIPRGWRLNEYKVGHSNLSDHRPVVADVTTPRGTR